MMIISRLSDNFAQYVGTPGCPVSFTQPWMHQRKRARSPLQNMLR